MNPTICGAQSTMAVSVSIGFSLTRPVVLLVIGMPRQGTTF